MSTPFWLSTCPSNSTVPLSGISSRLRHLKNVLFPLPEGPIMETASPFSTCSLTPSSTLSSPKLLCRSVTLIMAEPPFKRVYAAAQYKRQYKIDYADYQQALQR